MDHGDFLPNLDPAVQRLLPTYLANRRSEVAALRAAAERGDRDTLRRHGHDLRGSGGAYGVPGIQRLGEQLEVAAGAADYSTAHEIIDALDALLIRLVAIVEPRQ
jgi:HPt (histidine-containing phosphotransfer) domain-containing protein